MRDGAAPAPEPPPLPAPLWAKAADDDDRLERPEIPESDERPEMGTKAGIWAATTVRGDGVPAVEEEERKGAAERTTATWVDGTVVGAAAREGRDGKGRGRGKGQCRSEPTCGVVVEKRV